MLLIDAYNVLHKTDVLPIEHAELDVHGLIELLRRTRYAGTPTTLVCDGVRPGVGHSGPSATAIGDARVLYAGGGREADDEIERLLEVTSFAGRMLVVSSDKRIQKAAKRRRAGWTRSETFLKEIALDLGRRRVEPLPKWVHEIPLGDAQVAAWMVEFGLGEDWGPRVQRERPASDGASRTESAKQRIPSKPKKPTPPDTRTRVELDEKTRTLIEEHAIDPDSLDMDQYL